MIKDPTLEQAVAQIIPSSLDDIIRLRRDEFALRLATAEEISALPSMVSTLGHQIQIRATINEWRIVCLDHKVAGKKYILTGYNESTKMTWGTSELKSADLGNNLILTENSIYKLGTKGEGEPTPDLLLHICHLFHQWGFGKRFGVLEIFY